MLISQQTNLYIGFLFIYLRKTERKREGVQHGGAEGERADLNQAPCPAQSLREDLISGP